MSSTRPSESKPKLSVEELADLVSRLQTEVFAIKADSDVQVDSLQETVVNLAHENELLQRRLFGAKTEKLRTSENQLALGDLLDDEKQLQEQLNAAVEKAKSEAGQSDAPAPPAAPKGATPPLQEVGGLEVAQQRLLAEPSVAPALAPPAEPVVTKIEALGGPRRGDQLDDRERDAARVHLLEHEANGLLRGLLLQAVTGSAAARSYGTARPPAFGTS